MIIAYIICPECGHHIGGAVDATGQLLIPLAMCVVALIASKLITGKWIP